MKKLFVIQIVGILLIASCKTGKNAMSNIQVPVTELPEVEVIESRTNLYRASETKVNDLLHIDLKVKFDYAKQQLHGIAELTLQPHFYPTQELVLDAHKFNIHKIALLENGDEELLLYTYDTSKIKINLGKEFPAGKPYKILIEYTANPNDRKAGGSDAIKSDKGLFFINPLGKEKNKPTQIWTQGETESNSGWFPCIDKPNQKMTDQIEITVDTQYVTLSNGLLVKSVNNNNGTRTDIWKMDLPHSPYLVMMAIGKYAIIKDKWRDKEVNYYVEPQFADVAKDIFGNTPEMIETFSKELGVDYPWQKYAQVTARDYVSGAMENTSATLHGDFLQRTKRQLIDEKREDIIAHELFHQWFGDLATCESWSNLPLNESFATYGEYLWNEHKYGNFYADWKQYGQAQQYFREAQYKNVDMIRYYYRNREDMFDRHSYSKGGAILKMLRAYVGDSAFFKSLQLYLKTNSFKNTEIHHLRLAFEEVTGRDMNIFFNQWFLNSGHPVLDIKYSYDADSVYVDITQKHNVEKGIGVFELPMKVNVYYGNITMTYPIIFNQKKQHFAFKALGNPDLIDADAERILLVQKTENKTIDQYVFQFESSEKYLAKYEALKALKDSVSTNTNAERIYHWALQDKHFEIRKDVFKFIDTTAIFQKLFASEITNIATKDSVSVVRADAIDYLARLKNANFMPIFQQALNDSSYRCVAMALNGIEKLDTILSTAKAKEFLNEPELDLKNASYAALSKRYDKNLDSLFQEKLANETGYAKTALFYHYANYLTNCDSSTIVNGINYIGNLAISDESKHDVKTAKEAVQRITTYIATRKDASFKKGIDALATEWIDKLKRL